MRAGRMAQMGVTVPGPRCSRRRRSPISRRSWIAYLPGVAAGGLTKAVRAGVSLLPPWQVGLLFAAWAGVTASAGIAATVRRDVT
jgi:hypothetical protein